MAEENPQTFAEGIFGKGYHDDGLVKTFLSLPATVRIFGGTAFFAALLFVPFLGAVGLWDCWETHYGEVAREMVHRSDWVYPFWENAYFYSKPAMTMWMMALGMVATGTNDAAMGAGLPPLGVVIVTAALLAIVGGIAWFGVRLLRNKQQGAAYGAFAVAAAVLAIGGYQFATGVLAAGARPWGSPGSLSLYTEWGMRLPFALLSITAVSLLALAISRTVNKRAGLATGFVLMTMPMYFLITRQTVTDTPFVTAFVAAMACAIIGQLDKSTRRRAGWWYAFYVFAGIASLAKGLLGIAFPAAVLLIYAGLSVIPWNAESWRKHGEWLWRYARMPVVFGVAAAVGVAAVAYLAMKAGYSGVGAQRDHLLARKVFAGIIGFAVGSAVIAVLVGRAVPSKMEMPTLWGQFFRMRLGTGIAAFFAVALPWYLTVSLFEGVDDEGKFFWYRFFIHDHFNRLAAGVHTTTPGGTFTYFIEQGGFGTFPWVALVPGAFAIVARLKLRGGTAADHVGVIAAVWVALTFGLLGMSETKFHHYVFPVLPGLAILMGLFIDKLWEEGVARHAVALIFGLVLLMLVSKDLASNPKNFTDLFVYNYDRPYPFDLVTKPLMLSGTRPLWWGDLVAVVLLAFGGYLTYDAFMDKTRPLLTRALGLVLCLGGVSIILAMSLRGRASPWLLLGVAVLIASLYLGYEAQKENGNSIGQWLPTLVFGAKGAALLVRGMQVAAAQDPMLTRLMDPVNLKNVLGFAFGILILLAAVAAALKARTMLFGTFGAFALAFALWFNWSHWVDLAHHWTQRDLFWTYYKLRQPDEPIAAFLMNWRGETIYSKNEVKQIKDNGRMFQFANQPGREFALVEHNRLGILKSAVGPQRTVTTLSVPQTNNKFVLVSID